MKPLIRSILAVSILAIVPVEWLVAADVGQIGTSNQGQDAFGTPVGSYGSVDVGNDEQVPEGLEDLVGQGGNAFTVTIGDELAWEITSFTMTASGCSGAGTQNVTNINVGSSSALCTLLDNNLNQGCSWRGGGTMDVIGPFLCTLDHWEFSGNTVPARASTVDITGVIDAEAAGVDYFRMFHGGTLIESGAGTFDAVTNGVQMAAAIDALSGLIDVSYSAGTVTIAANSTGPTNFTDLRLEFITPATITSVSLSGISDADADQVNRFALSLDGLPIATGGLDFDSITTLSALTSALNGLAGIDVNVIAPEQIKIASSSAGSIVFSNLNLKAVPVATVAAGSVAYTENDSPVVVDPSLAVSGLPTVNLVGATVSLSPFTSGDQLSFTPTGSVSGSYSNGTLVLSGDAPIAEYQSTLRSVSFSSSADNPPASAAVGFVVDDGVDTSEQVSRNVAITAVNDRPTTQGSAASLVYSENDTTPVDAVLTIEDPDSTHLVGGVVSISSGFNPAEDELTFSDQNGISGTTSGSTLTLSGTATVAQYQAALRSVGYHNSSDAPDLTDRTVSIHVDDGVSTSVPIARVIQVSAVNDAPSVVTTPGSVGYPRSSQLIVDDAVAINDPDDDMLQNALVTVQSGFIAGEDQLLFVNQNGITGSYDDTTGVLTLVGEATVADYETALQTVRYSNTNPFAGGNERLIVFEVQDGVEWSNRPGRTLILPMFVDRFEARH